MKNDYKIVDDSILIFLKRRNQQVIETIVSREDFEIVNKIESTWYAGYEPHIKGFYVQGNLKSSSKDPEYRKVFLHRWIMNEPKGMSIDHINGNTLDNRRSNLRIVTVGQNQQNSHGLKSNNKSGLTNVFWNKHKNRWIATICVEGKKKQIGSFMTIDEAKPVIEAARRELMPYSYEAWCSR